MCCGVLCHVMLRHVMSCHVTRLLGRIRVLARYVQMQSAVSRLVCLGPAYTLQLRFSTHISLDAQYSASYAWDGPRSRIHRYKSSVEKTSPQGGLACPTCMARSSYLRSLALPFFCWPLALELTHSSSEAMLRCKFTCCLVSVCKAKQRLSNSSQNIHAHTMHEKLHVDSCQMTCAVCC